MKNIRTKSLSLESAFWVYLQKWQWVSSESAALWFYALCNQLHTFPRWVSRLGRVPDCRTFPSLRSSRVPQWLVYSAVTELRAVATGIAPRFRQSPCSADLDCSWERCCAGICQCFFSCETVFRSLRESLGVCQVDVGEPRGAWWPMLFTTRQCLQRKGWWPQGQGWPGVISVMHLLPTGHALYQNGSHCNTVWILGWTLLIFLYGELFKTRVFKGHLEPESPLPGGVTCSWGHLTGSSSDITENSVHLLSCPTKL